MTALPLKTVLAGLLLLACAAAWGEEISKPASAVDTSRWDCELCPYRYGWYGVIDVGAGWVSEASNKFGDYRGLDEDGGFPALDGDAHYRDREGRFFDVRAHDLGIDARRLQARGGVRGRYTFRLRYQEIPKYRGFGAQTVYRGVGGDSLTLPADWQPAPLTSGMGSLATSLRSIDLKTSRELFDAGLKWRLGSRWSYEVDFQHQAKDGIRPLGSGVLTINSSHFPAPVDFSTNRLDMAVNFDGSKSHWRLGFMGSSFDNALDSITWQNPFTAEPGIETLRTALEPDNDAYRFDLTGAWAPNPALRLSGSAAIGRMEQDDPLLPYSINPSFSDLPLPRLTAAGRIDVGTIDLAGKLSARLGRRLDLTARIERDERDNETPVDIWTPVVTDLIEGQPRPNRPYSFERNRASLALRYRPATSLRLQAGAKWEDYERTLQSVAETEEAGWFAEAALSAGSKVELRARLEQFDRDAEPYLPVAHYGLPEHPLMRKYNLADRDRERLRVDLDFFPTAELMLNIAFRRGEDEYDQSIIGLRKSEERSLSIDLSWTPVGSVTAHAYVSRDDFDSEQAGAESELADPWLGTTDDRFLTAGLGLTAKLGRKAELGFDFVVSGADGDIRTDSGAGEPPFPTLQTELRNARLRFEYRATERWGLKVHVEHERYDSTDWALDGIDPDGIPSILSFGADSPDYSVTVIRAQASYRF